MVFDGLDSLGTAFTVLVSRDVLVSHTTVNNLRHEEFGGRKGKDMSRFSIITLAAFALIGCQAGTEPLGPGQKVDSGSVDAGVFADATALDAGFVDSGSSDAGHPPGRLEIWNENEEIPVQIEGIAIAGTERWFANRYRLHAYGEAIIVGPIGIYNDLEGDYDRPIQTPAIAQVRVILGYPSPNGGGVRELPLVPLAEGCAVQGQAFEVPAESDVFVDILVDVATRGEVGESISGMQFRLGLGELTVFGRSSETNNLGVTVHTDTALQSSVVRVSKPELSLAPDSHTLINGQNTLMGLVVGPTGGPVAFGRLTFKVNVQGLDRANVNADIRNFRLYRNDAQNSIDSTEVNIFAVWSPTRGVTVEDLHLTGLDEMDGTQGDGVRSGLYILVVSFNQEEVVRTPVGHNYYLRVDVNGAVNGTTISTTLTDEDGPLPVTGITGAATCTPLENQPCSTGNGNTGRIFDTGPGEGLFTSTEQFVQVDVANRRMIWSDRSADNHAYPVIVGGQVVGGSGSYDWTNGFRLASVPAHTLTY